MARRRRYGLATNGAGRQGISPTYAHSALLEPNPLVEFVEDTALIGEGRIKANATATPKSKKLQLKANTPTNSAGFLLGGPLTQLVLHLAVLAVTNSKARKAGELGTSQ